MMMDDSDALAIPPIPLRHNDQTMEQGIQNMMKLASARLPLRTMLTVTLAAALGACGGGGDSTAPTPATPATPATPVSPLPPVPPVAPVPPVVPETPVTPAPASFSLGGTVSGLGDGATITIANGADSVTLGGNGSFALPTRLAAGASYSVSSNTPAGHLCSLSNGAGTVGSADVASIAIKCTAFLLAGKARPFTSAYAVAVDAAGASYVLDSLDQVIVKIDSAGAASVFAGSRNVRGHQDGAGAAASFWTNSSSRMAFDAQGNLILADTCNSLIRKITPAGVVSTLAGVPQVSCGASPTSGSVLPRDGLASFAVFNNPAKVAVHSNGNVVVVELNRATLRRISAAGAVTTESPLAAQPGSAISAIAFNQRNELVFASNSLSQRRIWRLDGGAAVLIAGGPASRDPLPADSAAIGAGFLTIRTLAFDKNDNLYIGDASSVRRLTPSGVVSNVAGSTARTLDGVGAGAFFSTVTDMAINAQGNLTVLQSDSSQLRLLTPAGAVTTSAATPVGREYADGKGSAARFATFDYLASGPDGSVYTLDTVNQVLRKITPDGTVSRFAGVAGVTGGVDGPVAGATLNLPISLAVDKSGVVYFIDKNGLRKVEAGVVSTIKASATLFDDGYYLRVLSDGAFLVAGSGDARILNANGELRTLLDSAFLSRLGFGYAGDPLGVAGFAVDAAGDAYILDANSSLVIKYSKSGVLSRFAGTINAPGNANGALGRGMLAIEGLSDMAIDPAGNLYFSGQGAIRKISADGVLSTPTLAWGTPTVFGLTVANGMLYGSTAAGIMQTPLP